MSSGNKQSEQAAALALRHLVIHVSGAGVRGQDVRIVAPVCAIGSGPDCTLRLRSASIDARQCVVERTAAGAIVRCEADSTRLNGDAFGESPLRAGDVLAVGPLELRIVDLGLPLAAPQPTPAAVPAPREAVPAPREAALDECRTTAQISHDFGTSPKYSEMLLELEQLRETLVQHEVRGARDRAAWEERQAALEEDRESLRRDRESAQQEGAALQQENAELQQELETLRREGAALQQQSDSLRQELESLRREGASLQQENAALQQELESLRREGAALQQESDSLQRQFSALQQENAALQRKLGVETSRAAALESTKAELETAQNAVAELQQELALQGGDDVRRLAEIEQLREECRRLLESQEAWNAERTALETALEDRVQESGEVRDAAAAQEQAWQTEREEWAERLEQQERLLQQSQDQLTQLQNEVAGQLDELERLHSMGPADRGGVVANNADSTAENGASTILLPEKQSAAPPPLEAPTAWAAAEASSPAPLDEPQLDESRLDESELDESRLDESQLDESQLDESSLKAAPQSAAPLDSPASATVVIEEDGAAAFRKALEALRQTDEFGGAEPEAPADGDAPSGRDAMGATMVLENVSQKNAARLGASSDAAESSETPETPKSPESPEIAEIAEAPEAPAVGDAPSGRDAMGATMVLENVSQKNAARLDASSDAASPASGEACEPGDRPPGTGRLTENVRDTFVLGDGESDEVSAWLDREILEGDQALDGYREELAEREAEAQIGECVSTTGTVPFQPRADDAPESTEGFESLERFEGAESLDDLTPMTPEEIQFIANDGAPPVSSAEVLARLGHQLDDDDEPAPLPVVAPPRAAPAPLAGGLDEDDEPIEEYMERLLKRVRGEDGVAVPAHSAAAPQPKPAPKAAPSSPPIQETPETPKTPKAPKMSAEDFAPRSRAPEATDRMRAMRELANDSARSAIQQHRSRDYVESVRRKRNLAFVSGGMVSVGVCLFVLGNSLAGLLALPASGLTYLWMRQSGEAAHRLD